MPVEVIMPKVDMDMDRGRIVVWHVDDGAMVAKGAPLFDIETDKAAMEVESPAAGILHHRAPEGAEVPIGQPVAWLYAPDEAVGPRPAGATLAADRPEAPAPGDAGSGAAVRVASGDTASAAPRTDPDAAPDPQSDGRLSRQRATPAARAQARVAGVALAGIAGTGPHGRVQGADVAAALAVAPVAGAASALAVTRRGARRAGGDAAPIVLLHGFAADAMSWAAVEPFLAGRDVIRIDLPGHGRSAPLAETGFASLAAVVRTTFDGLGLDRAHVVGHSLGGALALALADACPRQVAALTLIAPAGLGPHIDGAVVSGICAATRTDSLAPWLRLLVADPRLVTDSYARLAMDARRDPGLRAAQSAMADALFPDGTQAFDLTVALARLVPPARIIWGKADAVIPWAHALRAPGRVALHLFDGIGHMPQIECPEEVGKLLGQPL